METRITATELARNLSDILNRVRYKGERFRIVRNGDILAVIEPAAAPPARTFEELAERLGNLYMPEGFARDLELGACPGN
jgi:prevent-host-death family protein